LDASLVERVTQALKIDHNDGVKQPKFLAMEKKLVRYTFERLPPLTDAQRENLKKLAGRPDSEIDTSDIPELTEEQLKTAVRGRFYRPIGAPIGPREISDRYPGWGSPNIHEYRTPSGQ